MATRKFVFTPIPFDGIKKKKKESWHMIRFNLIYATPEHV